MESPSPSQTANSLPLDILDAEFIHAIDKAYFAPDIPLNAKPQVQILTADLKSSRMIHAIFRRHCKIHLSKSIHRVNRASQRASYIFWKRKIDLGHGNRL